MTLLAVVDVNSCE